MEKHYERRHFDNFFHFVLFVHFFLQKIIIEQQKCDVHLHTAAKQFNFEHEKKGLQFRYAIANVSNKIANVNMKVVLFKVILFEMLVKQMLPLH